MRKMLFLAALLMTTSTLAHAGDTFSFQVNGQRVKITRPSNCTSLSCINIHAPGLMDSKSEDSDTSSTAAATPAAPAQPQAAAPAPAQTQAAVAPQPQTSAASGAPVGTIPPLPTQSGAASNSNVTTLPAPASTGTESQQSTPAAPVQNQMVATAPTQVQPAAQPAPAPQAVANSPIGVWMTEKNEGKVRVVNCGPNICGYAINAKTGADGEQVLINMKPSSNGDGWKGRIKDTRGGGVYDSTVAMRGDNKLRVQGCAFGGMFCGGQTWTRIN